MRGVLTNLAGLALWVAGGHLHDLGRDGPAGLCLFLGFVLAVVGTMMLTE